jgi:hypothetical protein
MRNIVLSTLLLSLVVGGIIFFSCSKEHATPTFKTLPEIVNPMDGIGVLHNEGLEYVYAALEKSGTVQNSALKSAKGVKSLIDGSVSEFINSKNSSSAELYNKLLNDSKLKSASVDPVQTAKEICDKFTPMQKKYLRMILLVSKNEKIGLKRTVHIIKQIEAQAKLKCTEEEVGLVLCAASVARYTAQYWHDNYQKWNALNRPNTLKDFDIYVDGAYVGIQITSYLSGNLSDYVDSWFNGEMIQPSTPEEQLVWNWKSFLNADIGGAIYATAALTVWVGYCPECAAAAMVQTGGTIAGGMAIFVGGAAAGSSAYNAYEQWVS